MSSLYTGKTILVTGGTGSFGKEFVRFLLKKCNPRKVIIFSRDEFKQFQFERELERYPNVRFFLGDIRDYQRLKLAFQAGIDIVVHAAALKQIPALEYNPSEAIETNVRGTQNIITVSLEAGVSKVLLISTDKAASPANLYGATKMAAEKLVIASNAYAGKGPTRFSAVRYGNVLNSRGSIVETILDNTSTTPLSLTDTEMTRFWITLEQAHQLVTFALTHMKGGEIFIPRAPSMRVVDLFSVLAPNRKVKITGIRPGEKLHETLITSEEMRNTCEVSSKYLAILPHFATRLKERCTQKKPADLTKLGFYASNTNSQWLTEKQLKKLLRIA